MITKFENYCLCCGKPRQDIHHLICGTGARKLADKHELYIPVCRDCHSQIHNSPIAMKLSKFLGQLEFEKKEILKGATEDEARERFRVCFSKSYL